MSVRGANSSRLPATASEPFLQMFIRIILQVVSFLLNLFMGSFGAISGT
jgi:hypothetical protein